MKQIKSPGETIESHGGNENFNFVQLSRSYLHQMRKLARKSPIAHEILYYLVEHMGRTTNAVVCSYTTLCEITGVSRPAVGRAIKLLKDDQWIDTVKIGNANAYCVNERCSGKLEEIKENTRSSQQQLSHLPPIRRAISRKSQTETDLYPNH